MQPGQTETTCSCFLFVNQNTELIRNVLSKVPLKALNTKRFVTQVVGSFDDALEISFL